MIYEIPEIKSIVPALAGKSDEQIKYLLQKAEVRILGFLKWKKLPEEIPVQIKTACVWLIEHEEKTAKTENMTSFRQGNISVNYADATTQKNNLEENLRHLLAPLIQVKIWS